MILISDRTFISYLHLNCCVDFAQKGREQHVTFVLHLNYLQKIALRVHCVLITILSVVMNIFKTVNYRTTNTNFKLKLDGYIDYLHQIGEIDGRPRKLESEFGEWQRYFYTKIYIKWPSCYGARDNEFFRNRLTFVATLIS